jgi:hypothetical protein
MGDRAISNGLQLPFAEQDTRSSCSVIGDQLSVFGSRLSVTGYRTKARTGLTGPSIGKSRSQECLPTRSPIIDYRLLITDYRFRSDRGQFSDGSSGASASKR